MVSNRNFELIVSIVNRGYSDYVVSASRDAGATGGTIVFARGTSNTGRDESFMGISIQPEKDIVLILVRAEERKKVMQAICDSTSALEKSGHGICFSMPVNHVVGIKDLKHKAQPLKKPVQKKEDIKESKSKPISGEKETKKKDK